VINAIVHDRDDLPDGLRIEDVGHSACIATRISPSELRNS
jgi:hypothetical protein